MKSSPIERLEALSRTLLLLRDHVGPQVSDSRLAEALGDTHVLLVANRANLREAGGQGALITTGLLAARLGATVRLAIDDVPLCGAQPPLTGGYLAPGLADLLDDVVPPACADQSTSREPDIVVAIGDSPWRGTPASVVRLQADCWAGSITCRGPGASWRGVASPFGALAAAGLAAGEVLKAAMPVLAPYAFNLAAFEEFFRPTVEATIRLAPPGTPEPPSPLASFDCISGGAIIQSLLYAMFRIPDVSGEIRVIEPEISDLSNLNRYALLRKSRVGSSKASDLRDWAPAGLSLGAIAARYDDSFQVDHSPLAPMVAVGVDDIPSRWAVQAAAPRWLGIGATTHYSAMSSFHIPGMPCARCLHPRDDPTEGPIPTLSIVSHWAGLWLATMLLREQVAARPPASEQSLFMTPLRAEAPAGVWFAPVAPRGDCPLRCMPS